jgi:hypothetical protein
MLQADEYLRDLKSALDAYRFQDAARLGDRILPSRFDDRQIKTALGLIRRKRQFAELERIAGLFAAAGKRNPLIRRQWAQALLDQNRIEQALDVLTQMLPEVAGSPEEAEVQGLLGRAYKQRFVNEGNPGDLAAAARAYMPFWTMRKGDYRWHGISAAALAARGRRDGIDIGVDIDPAAIARVIRDEIEDGGLSSPWDYASALEASIALQERGPAIEWTGKYVKHPDADAFEIASTLRQLKQVWQLETTAPELSAALLPVLEFALLNREGGQIESTAAAPLSIHDQAGFQAVYGSDSYVYVEWMDTLYRSCRAVARVFNPRTGKKLGTGFVLQGDAVNPAWGAAPVLVTNAHVISADPADRAAAAPADAQVEFTRLPDRPAVGLGEVLFSSPKFRLDATVLRIEPPPDAAMLELATALPPVPAEGAASERLYVIGHPGGGELAVSLYDNGLIGYETDFVHYRSPTEPGSSGSPVLSRELKLLAKHHRSREDRQANEGVCMLPICAAARAACK